MNLSRDKKLVSVLVLLASLAILITLVCMDCRKVKRVPGREIMRMQKMGDEIKDECGNTFYGVSYNIYDSLEDQIKKVYY